MSKNIINIIYNDDGSIQKMDDVRLFKLSNGITQIKAKCHYNPSFFEAYINFMLPNEEQINSRLMSVSEPTQDGYFVYDYIIQAEELQFKGNLTMSISFMEKISL